MNSKAGNSPAKKKNDDTESATGKPIITKTIVGNRNRGAVLRLQQDYINLNKDPVPYIRGMYALAVYILLSLA